MHFSDRMNWNGSNATTQYSAIIITRSSHATTPCIQVFQTVVEITKSGLDHLIIEGVAGTFNLDNIELF